MKCEAQAAAGADRMDPTAPSSSPPVLPYATPPTRSARPFRGTFVAILGAAMGLYAATMLFCGVVELIHLIKNNQPVFPSKVFEISMFLIIGAFCSVVALRWCRAAHALFRGR